MPYGFPSGSELRLEVVKSCQEEGWCTELVPFGFPAKDVRRFGVELQYSGRLSVDAFLEHRHDYLAVGKMAIARVLSTYEHQEHLAHPPHNGAWYSYLFDRMSTKPEEFGMNQVAFITFNYDRSLEHFLFTALTHSYKMEWQECAEILSHIPIVHVHGQLGPLTWQDRQRHRLYRGNGSLETLPIAADGIKILSEANPESPELTRAKELLDWAEQIYCLGFGYNPTNTERLGIYAHRRKKVMGTTRGLKRQEIRDLVGSAGIKPVDGDHDVLDFLKDIVVFK